MRYFIVSDTHGFYTELIKALTEAGFFEYKGPKKLILCGDAMDRGTEAVKLQEFLMDLHKRDELIFIRGNHEDLLIQMLNAFEVCKANIEIGYSHHIDNGTFDTACQLSGMSAEMAIDNSIKFVTKVLESDFCKILIPTSVNYFEAGDYIFTHAYIPTITEKNMPAWYKKGRTHKYDPFWRDAHSSDWDNARWVNGMEIAEKCGITEPDKTIVVGHWHTSWGHCHLENKTSEFGKDADFSPYYGKGIIAIDACTAHTGKVNCLVLDI